METILQLSRRMAHNASPSSMSMEMKYSPTESLKLSTRDNKRIERRKPNWTEAENVFLLDQFGLHREILTCKATDASTNLKKQEIWRVICQNLNTHNTLVRRTPAEVRRKWKNLVTAAKKEVWEMRHQIHLSGSSGPNGRKISELSQRVLQLHSSGGFSGGNPNGLYGTLLSAGLIGPPSGSGSGGGGGGSDKYSSKYGDSLDDKSYIPAHFTPIITLSESNNNHISLMGNHSGHSGDGPPSPLSEDDDDDSSDSRNATEFMSDSGIYEQEGIDLRVNVGGRSSSLNLGLNGIGSGVSVGSGGITIEGSRIGRHIAFKNNNNNNSIVGDGGANLDPEDDEDVEGDEDVEEDMTLLRYSNHLNLAQKLKNSNFHLNNSSGGYISTGGGSSLYNNNNINNNNDNNHHSRGGGGGGGSSFQPEVGGDRKSSETTNEISPSGLNGDLIDATLKLRNHFIASLKESDLLTNLYKERLELQIQVLKLRKQKLSQELKAKPRNFGGLNRFLNNNNSSHFTRFRLKQWQRNTNHCNNFLRLKPKNTWINFAASNNNKIAEISDKSTNTEQQQQQQPQVMVNGNSKGQISEHEEEEEENK